jgi:hypothetical protein
LVSTADSVGYNSSVIKILLKEDLFIPGVVVTSNILEWIDPVHIETYIRKIKIYYIPSYILGMPGGNAQVKNSSQRH